MLQGSIYGSWDIDKPGEKDRIRREFREYQSQAFPDHPHLIEQALEELLPGGILDELDPPPPPIVVNPPSVEEPKPTPDITKTTPVAEPANETSTAPTTQPSSREEAPAALPAVQEGLRRIQQAMTIAHARGMSLDDTYTHVDKLMKKYEITSLQTEFIEPLLALWQQPAPEPQPQPHPVPTGTCAEEETWISTWDLPLQDRLQRIVDFMEQAGRINYTRQQIEIGAGYRHPDDILDKKTYEKLTRRLQRDLGKLIEDGDIVRIEKLNPKQKGGFKNKIFLYALAPLEPQKERSTPHVPRWYTPDLKKCLTGALEAFDAYDVVKLKDYLTTALDALDAFDGQ
jgi:hypothetical protein